MPQRLSVVGKLTVKDINHSQIRILGMILHNFQNTIFHILNKKFDLKRGWENIGIYIFVFYIYLYMLYYMYAIKIINTNFFSLFLKEDNKELLFGSLVLEQKGFSIDLNGTKKKSKKVTTLVRILLIPPKKQNMQREWLALS